MTATTTATDKPCANPRRSIHAISAKAAGALIAIQLILAGCTGGISPTVSPTTETPKPALTAPLPTATKEHTKTPTLTPTPTEIPVKATPDSSRYPTTISDQPLTDETLEKRKTDFATLVSSNKTVASEFRTIETRIGDICDNGCTIEGVLDQDHWGVIARNSDGIPLVLQKTKDGGKTWVNVVDASAYSELVANAKFDKANYKLTQLQRPSGIPEDATGEVMTQNNWMVYVWRDKTTGKILAWYDAANDQYLTVDGKKLEAELVYTPFEPGKTTWEDCQKNKIPWLSEDKKELVRKLKQFHQFDLSSSEISTGIIESFVPLFNEPYTFADKVWYISELYYNISSPKVQIPICGTLQNPHGDIMPVYALPVTFQLPDGTYYPTTIAVAMDMNFVKKLAQDNYGDDPERIEGVLLRASPENKLQGFSNLNSIHIGFLTSEQPLTAGTIPESEAFATLYNYNLDNGYAQILLKALQGQATKEEIDLLIDTILPVFRININL